MDPIERFENKLDRMLEKQTGMEVTLVKQHVSLEEHMRRSAALEDANDLIRQELIPLKQHVAGFSVAGKLFVGLGVVAGVILGVWELWLKVRW